MQPCNQNHCWDSWIINKGKQRVYSALAFGSRTHNLKIKSLFCSLQFRDADKHGRIQRRTRGVIWQWGNTEHHPSWLVKDTKHRLDHILKWDLVIWGFFHVIKLQNANTYRNLLIIANLFFHIPSTWSTHPQMIRWHLTPTKIDGVKHPNGLTICPWGHHRDENKLTLILTRQGYK